MRETFAVDAKSMDLAIAAGWNPEGWETATPVLLLNWDNRKIAMFHYGLSGFYNIPKIAWEADVIICCNPQVLPPGLRAKHVFPDWRGEVYTEMMITRSTFSVRCRPEDFIKEVSLIEIKTLLSGFSTGLQLLSCDLYNASRNIESTKAFVDSMKFN
jgi:hypothetical protein